MSRLRFRGESVSPSTDGGFSSRRSWMVAIIATVLALPKDSQACWRARRSRACARIGSAQPMYYAVSRSQAFYQRAYQVFASKKFSSNDIPRGTFPASTLDPILVTLHWGRVQESLERLFAEIYCLPRVPQIPLLVKWVNKPHDPQILRFVFVEPEYPFIKLGLRQILHINDEEAKSMFVPRDEVLP